MFANGSRARLGPVEGIRDLPTGRAQHRRELGDRIAEPGSGERQVLARERERLERQPLGEHVAPEGEDLARRRDHHRRGGRALEALREMGARQAQLRAEQPRAIAVGEPLGEPLLPPEHRLAVAREDEREALGLHQGRGREPREALAAIERGEQRQGRTGHQAEADPALAERLLERLDQRLRGERHQRVDPLAAVVAAREARRGEPELLDAEGDQPLEAEAQHVATLRLVVRQVAELDDQAARPGVRQDERGPLDPAAAALEQTRERVLDRATVEPGAPLERARSERRLRERHGLVFAELEGAAAPLGRERRVPQLPRGQREDVRRHRHRVEAGEAPNPRT